MNSYFSADFFASNRDRLRAAVGDGVPIIVTGNGQMQQKSDEAYPFTQDSSFWYLTGLNAPDLTLVMLESESYLLVPQRSFVREAFDGAHDKDAYVIRSGVTQVIGEVAGWQRLRAELQAAKSIATLASPPTYIKHHGLHTLPYRRRLIAKLKRINSSLTIQDIRPELAVLRSIKQPSELQALQRAIDITCESLQALTSSEAFQAAKFEYELEAELSYEFRRRGADGHAFAPIVGAGKHTTTLHYMDNNSPIAVDDAVVLDVGAGMEHYAADITRTVSRRPITGRYAEVFRAVADVQDYALGLIKPGVVSADYEKAVEAYMGEQLVRLGIIQDPTHEKIRRYFPHSTSHFLGLDVHDTGDYRAPWQENMVITCEPGIYIPEEGIGVRIEDDVLLTSDGCKVLSAACPRELTRVQ